VVEDSALGETFRVSNLGTTTLTGRGGVAGTIIFNDGYQMNMSRAGANYFQATTTGGYFFWGVNGGSGPSMTLDAAGNWYVVGASGYTYSIADGHQQNWSRGGANYIKATSAGGYFLWRVNGSGTNVMYLDTAGDLHLLQDNGKLYFGEGDDSQIYFNGTTSWVFNTATGTGHSFQINGSEIFRVGAASAAVNVQLRLDDNALRFQEHAGPSTPASGFGQVFLDNATGNLSILKDTGVTVDLETPGDGGGGGNDLAPTAVKTGAYDAVAWDAVLCDTSGGTFTVTLPAAGAGDQILVKMVGTGVVTLTIDGDGATIDGNATKLLLAQYESLLLLADGSNWHIIG
jgi:hypothetical protein